MAKDHIYYFDYTATTKPATSVVKCFCDTAENNFANPNSNHKLGLASKKVIDNATKNIASYLHVKPNEIIYTSGSSESNNTVLKCVRNGEKKHVITSELEHSSIFGPIGYLQNHGYSFDFAPLKNDGTVDIAKLEKMIRKDTLLVSIVAVDSETGVRQPVEEIGKMIHEKFPAVYFHSDITQLLGKDNVDLSNIDLASFTGQKINCFKGIGALVKKENVKMEPLIHGGKAVTIYRSGTPSTELIASLSKAFDLFKNDIDERKKYVEKLNFQIRNHLKQYDKIVINSTEKSMPYILNISFLGKNPNLIQNYFANHNIYISTKTACANDSDYSKTVFNLTGSMERAKSSVRISLSYETTEEEIDHLLKEIDELMEHYDKID